ncbi:hypothetical protein BDR07DRAFT_210733 [Suillus spraguei]|nr:hypothetical protein BDR07DRAFT_210733 [Suillus spraguei]
MVGCLVTGDGLMLFQGLPVLDCTGDDLIIRGCPSFLGLKFLYSCHFLPLDGDAAEVVGVLLVGRFNLYLRGLRERQRQSNLGLERRVNYDSPTWFEHGETLRLQFLTCRFNSKLRYILLFDKNRWRGKGNVNMSYNARTGRRIHYRQS